MRIFLTDQSGNFDSLLEDLMTKPVIKFDKTKLIEKASTIELNTERVLGKLDLDFLFNYEVFPSHIMTFKTQWSKEQRKMKIGDTILQQVFIPPTRLLSQKLVVGVRINRIIDEVDKKGFGYETLVGHVEMGESAFTVETSNGGLIFKIKTFSKPGNRLTRLVESFFTLPYQTYCTQLALKNVRRQIERQ